MKNFYSFMSQPDVQVLGYVPLVTQLKFPPGQTARDTLDKDKGLLRMNTLQQITHSDTDTLTLPIETGLKYSKKLIGGIKHSVDVVQIDMSAMTTINARELGKLLRLQRAIQQQGKKIRLVNVSTRAMLFLELTQANSIFEVSMNQNQFSGFAA